MSLLKPRIKQTSPSKDAQKRSAKEAKRKLQVITRVKKKHLSLLKKQSGTLRLKNEIAERITILKLRNEFKTRTGANTPTQPYLDKARQTILKSLDIRDLPRNRKGVRALIRDMVFYPMRRGLPSLCGELHHFYNV